MMNFCTLFDSNYISKGIALYVSIERHTDDFILYVMAMDRKCKEELDRCSFKHMKVDCIDDVMSPELDKAKKSRSRAEFCWTCGSYFTDYFMHHYQLPDITYLDSDLMFFNSPQTVFDELSEANASVGIVSHFSKFTLFGKYNVEYVYFKNDADGVAALSWWRNECLKWCYSKLENGKYGDQKYLDYFADKFNHVHEIQHRGVGVASWNMDQYRFPNGSVLYKKTYWPIVFFHYSGFNISTTNGVLHFKHTMYLKKTILETFVEPYAELLSEVFSKYLNTTINTVVFEPLNQRKYQIKKFVYYLSKVIPIDHLVILAMKFKYRERKLPYSER